MNSSYAIEYDWPLCHSDQDLKNLADKILANTARPLVLTMLWEALAPNLWVEKFKTLTAFLQQVEPNVKIFLVLNSWYKSTVTDLAIADHVEFLDFFMLMAYDRVIVNQHANIASSWSPDKKTFLFLTGFPARPNRIRLLYKFYQKKLLTQAQWSLFMTVGIVNEARKFLPELTEEEFNQFVDSHLRNPDSIDLNISQDNLFYCGIPYSSDMYFNSKFQVVSETEFIDEPAWITEKTWLAMLNRRPFIMASAPRTLAKLKSLGFRTFENYLKIQNYDLINDAETRLHAVVANTEFWLYNIEQFKDQIIQDVDHNFNRLVELAKVNQLQLDQLITATGLSRDIVPLRDMQQEAKWANWYNRIRDPQWPDCPEEKDFDNLPEWIQQECINIFGYKPKEKK